MAATRLAVLDLGSNSFHLAVFPRRGSTVLAARREVREPVRLGDSIAGGRIDGAGFARGLAAVERLLEELERDEPGCPVIAVATSAIREADNGAAFAAEVERRHGFTVEILSGEQEARATYAGARAFAGPRRSGSARGRRRERYGTGGRTGCRCPSSSASAAGTSSRSMRSSGWCR